MKKHNSNIKKGDLCLILKANPKFPFLIGTHCTAISNPYEDVCFLVVDTASSLIERSRQETLKKGLRFQPQHRVDWLMKIQPDDDTQYDDYEEICADGSMVERRDVAPKAGVRLPTAPLK